MNPLLLASLALIQPDPAPSLTRSKARARTFECERMTVEAARRERPGLVFAAKPRGDYLERSVVICTARVLRPGLRADRDEAILSDLDTRARELAVAAASPRPDLAGFTWLVESYHPSAQVSAKLSFAAKNALMSQGLGVSDRVPMLGVGDLQVITRMPPTEAYPAACARYFANGGLRPTDALLAVVALDPRETALHAGLCTGGQWTWLR